MRTESVVKQDQIVEAAIRRFSHFGIAKTTLTEVADDLAVSKQSLAYYFPDKHALVQAVVEKIGDDYYNHLQQHIAAAASVEQALMKLAEVKGSFFEKYFMLAMQADHIELNLSASVQSWRNIITDKEVTLITALFEKGVGQGELKPLNAAKTASLLLETMYAFSRCVKAKGALPDAAAFTELVTKQQEVILLFYKGLKSETWEN